MNQTTMPRYIGTKTLFARPMTRGEYNAYRLWTPPVGEDQDVPGYLVEYEDGGAANDSRHAGYISWSPKDVFERTYHSAPANEPLVALEDEIQAKAAKAPRITAGAVEAAIISEHYFTAADGARLNWLTADHSDPGQRDAVVRIGESMSARSYAGTCQDIDANSNGVVVPELGLLTFCVLVLRNGFTVTGTSACVSPAIFDADIGRRVAREDAVRQVWPLLGYALKEKLAAAPTDYRDRVLLERNRVAADLEKLTAFLASDKVSTVDAADIELMRAQAAAMTDYRDILDDRIERFAPAVSSL